MPKHPDAIGYLKDLAKDICEPWFTMVSDLAVTSRTSTLDQATTPQGSGSFFSRIPGMWAYGLNPRLMAGIPPGCTLSQDAHYGKNQGWFYFVVIICTLEQFYR